MISIIYKEIMMLWKMTLYLADYIATQEEGLDAIDIQDIMEDKFSFDEEFDDPKDIQKKS